MWQLFTMENHFSSEFLAMFPNFFQFRRRRQQNDVFFLRITCPRGQPIESFDIESLIGYHDQYILTFQFCPLSLDAQALPLVLYLFYARFNMKKRRADWQLFWQVHSRVLLFATIVIILLSAFAADCNLQVSYVNLVITYGDWTKSYMYWHNFLLTYSNASINNNNCFKSRTLCQVFYLRKAFLGRSQSHT